MEMSMNTKATADSSKLAEALWTANDVAAFLRVSRSWVYHRSESGDLPCLRVGGLSKRLAPQVDGLLAAVDALYSMSADDWDT